MAYKSYQSYKSGDYFKSLPDEWCEERLRDVAAIKTSNVDKKTYEDQESVQLCNYVDVYYNSKINSNITFMKATASKSEIKRFKLNVGDVVITKDSEDPFDIGIPALVDEDIEDLVCGYHLSIMEALDNRLIGRYLFYALESDASKYQFTLACNGVTRFGLTQKGTKNLKICVPSIQEQQKIADFLDHKTSKIDELIERKTELIEKLNEQRIAVITQAVTQGIDKDVKMKPSGMDWLGSIPEHWKVKKFRYLFSLGRGLGIKKSDLKEQGVPCINYGEIHSRYGFEIIPEKHELKCVDGAYLDSSSTALLKNGDFVFADTSEDVDGSGNFSYLNSDVLIFAGYHTVIARLVTSDSSRYLAYIFDSLMYRFQIRKNVTGVKVFSITQNILKSSYLWIPPLGEQKNIVDYLDAHLRTIDNMKDINLKTIEKLIEYRSSLITSVITGKIDVRNIKIGEA